MDPDRSLARIASQQAAQFTVIDNRDRAIHNRIGNKQQQAT